MLQVYKRANNPFDMVLYLLNMSPELDMENTSYFSSMIGIMRWMRELGHVNIRTYSSYLALPLEGNLEAALLVITYMRQKYSSDLAYILTYPEINWSKLKKCNWL